MSYNKGPASNARRVHRPLSIVAAYLAMVAAAVGIFFLVKSYGDTLVATASPSLPPAETAGGSGNRLFHLLLALTAIIVLGKLLAKLFAYIQQPPVIGEVVAGILLGPSLLGVHVSGWIMPASVAPYLGAVAQLGVVLYMFMIGTELDLSVVRNRVHVVVATSHASILLPFVLGVLSALVLYPRLAPGDVGFTTFSLFMGVAMSITAFPVLARILSDHGLTKTKLGALALSCAAVDDFTAWCLLAFVVGVATATAESGLLVVLGALAYIAFMLVVVRPLVARLVKRWEQAGPGWAPAASLIVLMLVSATLTEAIGIHAIFGAFLAGVLVPHDSTIARNLSRQLKGVVLIVLLPAFFAFAGMRTRIDLLSNWSLWLMFALVLVVAVAGKFGGAYSAARLAGLGGRGSSMLGVLMNTRGLMELIVLNVGLDLGVVSPELYTLMVLMALATTALTSPLLRLLQRRATPAEREELLTQSNTT